MVINFSQYSYRTCYIL